MSVRVLMFGWEFPPMINGGIGTACYGLTRHLALKDVAITFVLPKVSMRMHHYFLNIIDGDQFIDTDKIEKQATIEETYNHLEECIEHESLLAPYESEKRYEEIYRSLEENRSKYRPLLFDEVTRYAKLGSLLGKEKSFDVIHAHDWMSFDAAIKAKEVSGKPLITHFHTTEYDRRGKAIDLRVFNIEKNAMERSDRIIVVSKLMKVQIVERYSVSPEKIEVIYNAVEKGETIDFDKRITHFHNKKVIFFLGRITSQKGPEIFLEAAETVKKSVKDAVFVMAGDGDLAGQVQQKCFQKGMSECFFFPGHLRSAEKEKLLAVSDVYVLSSLAEPFGITLTEVMQYDIPIVMTEGLGAHEVAPDSLEFKFGDSEDLAQKIKLLLENPEVVDQVTCNYGKQLDRLDWNVTAMKVIQIYKQLC
jgi:glycosyltransferase involved in cell wall biosynthesis